MVPEMQQENIHNTLERTVNKFNLDKQNIIVIHKTYKNKEMKIGQNQFLLPLETHMSLYLK
jgi:hypothetical protein